MRRLRGEVPDVFVYDDLSAELRVQINYIIEETLGSDYLCTRPQYKVAGTYETIVRALRREFGVTSLGSSVSGYKGELQSFISNHDDVEMVMSAIELSFRAVDRLTRSHTYLNYDLNDEQASEKADEAIAELNHRFKEHGVGYRFEVEAGEIIRVDSELLHDAAVKPALLILSSPGYEGPREEFLSAYDHYRHGNNKEAMNDALKAFESTMKVICHMRGWPHDQRATANTLIGVCFSNGLVPAYLQHWFTALRTTLESGVPTSRNRASGHGQGVEETRVPDYLVAYVLHITASAIVMLSEADKALG